LGFPVKSLGALWRPLVHALFGILVPVGRSKLLFLAAGVYELTGWWAKVCLTHP
jgi:hypothetical protein